MQKLDQRYTPRGITEIGTYAFDGCTGLTDFTFPKSITSISERMLSGTGLVSVVIPDHITEIGASAFSNCQSLIGVTIPGSVTSINTRAFSNCPELKEIQFLGDAPTFGTGAFYNDVITAYYPKDNQTWALVVNENYGGQVTWLTEEVSHFQLVGSSVSLGDSLDFHFFMNGEDVEMTDHALITRSYADGREPETVMIPGSQWGVLDDGKVYVTYEGIAAKEMGDTITITICDFEGNAISEAYADSIQAYAMRMLEKESDPELLTLLVDMLGYGAEAQTYFGYNTENLVNDDLTEAQKGYATAAYEAENLLEAGDGRAATALTLKNRIRLDLFFDCGVTGTDYVSLYATVSYTDHYGEAVELRIEGEDFAEAEGFRVCVSVPGLAAADYSQAVTCTVYDAEGNAIAWVTDSIGGYVARMADDIPDIVAAIAKFGTAARNYFH